MKGKFHIYLLFTLVFFLFLRPIDSSDFFHHIAAGRDIVSNWTLPYTDTHTFTAFGKPWIAHSWGSGLAYYAIYQLFGLNGVNMFFALLGLGTISFLLLLSKNQSGHPFVTTALLLIGSATLSLYWPSRPLIMGPFFLATLLLLLKFYKKYYYLLPIFFWVWGVFYGASALLGIIVFGLYLICERGLWNIKNISGWLLSLLASCLNGYGLQSLLYGFGSELYMQTQEWLPVYQLIGLPLVPLAGYRLAVYFGWLLITAGGLFYGFKYKKNLFKQHLFEGLLALGVLSPLLSFRYISLVPIFVIPFMDVFIRQAPEKLQSRISGILTGLAVLIIMIRIAFVPLGFGIFQVKAEQPFLDVIEFMQSHKIYGDVYTTQNLGPRIYWSMPESKVFIDTRDDLFINTNVFQDLRQVFDGDEPITNLLDKYGANIVIGRPADIYKPLLNNQKWQFVYRKEYFIAIRKSE
jgi:hypothetical protein